MISIDFVEDMIYKHRLTMAEIKIYLCLTKKADDFNEVSMSYSDLSDYTELSRQTIATSLKKLEEVCLIRILRKKYCSNLYILRSV